MQSENPRFAAVKVKIYTLLTTNTLFFTIIKWNCALIYAIKYIFRTEESHVR